MSKKQSALNLISSNPTWSRTQFIQAFMTQLDMSKAGANTYYSNCRKQLSQPTQTNDEAPIPTLISKEVVSNISGEVSPLSLIKDEVYRIIRFAEQTYNVDLSSTVIKFDLKGRATGQAIGRRIGLLRSYELRLNMQAVSKHYDYLFNMTIPHEVAHLVCYANPGLGKNHDAGWKRVCATLGGNSSRCHSLDMKSTKNVSQYQYTVTHKDRGIILNAPVQITISAKRHNLIQRGMHYVVKNERGALNKTCTFKRV